MQPISGGEYINIAGTAAGTANIKARSCVLDRIIIPSTKTGTVTFYDNAAGTTAASAIFEIVNDTVDFPTVLECNLQCKNGLSYARGGTVGMTVIVR
jgi:hypothetical protein